MLRQSWLTVTGVQTYAMQLLRDSLCAVNPARDCSRRSLDTPRGPSMRFNVMQMHGACVISICFCMIHAPPNCYAQGTAC